MKWSWLALPLLAACATPGEVRRDGTRTDWTLTLPAKDAARCMARNAEEHAGYVIVQTREADPAGAFEVLVRGPPDTTIAVAVITPAGRGATATVWRAKLPLLPTDLPGAMAKGC